MKEDLQLLQGSSRDPSLCDFYRDHFILCDERPQLREKLLESLEVEDVVSIISPVIGGILCQLRD